MPTPTTTPKIPSAAHLVGYRTSEVPDSSRNLWWAALLTPHIESFNGRVR
jgi:fatty-acid desaturase